MAVEAVADLVTTLLLATVVEMLVTAEKPQARTLQLEQLTVAEAAEAAEGTMLVMATMPTVLTADQVFSLFDI